MPQTSTTKPSNKEKAPKAPTTGVKRGPKKKPRDPVTGKIIRPVYSDGNIIVQTRKLRKNKENGNQILKFFINNLFNNVKQPISGTKKNECGFC